MYYLTCARFMCWKFKKEKKEELEPFQNKLWNAKTKKRIKFPDSIPLLFVLHRYSVNFAHFVNLMVKISTYTYLHRDFNCLFMCAKFKLEMTSKIFSLHYLKVSVSERGKRVLIIANYKMCAHRHIRGPIQERVKRLEMIVKM